MNEHEMNALAEKNKQDFNTINTWTRPVIKRPTIISIIDRVKPESRRASFKEIFLKKLRVIMGRLCMKERANSWEPTLEDAFVYLGQAQARLAMLEEVHTFIQHTLSTNLPMWPQELFDLRELSRQQIATCTQLVKAILYRADKEQQENKTLPLITDVMGIGG